MELKTPTSLNASNLPESWRKFKNSWHNYAIACELSKKDVTVQVAIFLNILKEEGQDLLDGLELQEAEKNTVEKLIKALDEHSKPETNKSFSRYLFNSRKQQEFKSFEDFYGSLKKLAEPCDFKDLKQSLIKDQVLLGINNQPLRERLLGEDMDLSKVVKICQAAESGKKQAEQITNGPAEVHSLLQNTHSKQFVHPIVNQPFSNNQYFAFSYDSDEEERVTDLVNPSNPTNRVVTIPVIEPNCANVGNLENSINLGNNLQTADNDTPEVINLENSINLDDFEDASEATLTSDTDSDFLGYTSEAVDESIKASTSINVPSNPKDIVKATKSQYQLRSKAIGRGRSLGARSKE